MFTNVFNTVVDPKNFDAKSFVDLQGEVCIVPPNSFALARSVEYFRIPRDLLTICLGKSTYARCGIIVNVTPFEPEWEGHVTLEISNTTPLPAKIYANEGLAQVLFFRAASVHDAVRLLQGMCGVYGMVDPHTLPAFSFHRFGDEQLKEIWPAFALLFFFLLVWIFPNSLQLLARYQPSLSDIRPSGPLAFIWRPTLAWAVLFGCAAALALLSATGLTEFIYFRF